jgi:hypothetical protein
MIVDMPRISVRVAVVVREGGVGNERRGDERRGREPKDEMAQHGHVLSVLIATALPVRAATATRRA